ncbi:MAG TPA: GIY-YIG nuclease family protein [Gemmatimonadales bacterium]|nr:GIY-YIG nuclease family protein [Gemmatimonadales bacterium]
MTVDRKALSRRYKDTPRPMGVGVVRNLTNGRVLLVSSRDLPSMLNRQRAQLSLDAHANRALQQDWNALGPASFAFEVLDTLEPADTPDYDPAEDLEALKALWMEKLSPFEPDGYHPRPA